MGQSGDDIMNHQGGVRAATWASGKAVYLNLNSYDTPYMNPRRKG